MRDEPRAGPATPSFLACAAVLLCLTAAPARGQVVRGYTQIQYQGLDLVGSALDRDILYSVVQVDVNKRFQDNL